MLPYYPYRGPRRILPFGYIADPDFAPLLPLWGAAPNSAFWLHGGPRFCFPTTGSGRVRFVWFEKSRTAGVIREQCLPCPLGHYTSVAPSERQRPRATFCTLKCKVGFKLQRGNTYARGDCRPPSLHLYGNSNMKTTSGCPEKPVGTCFQRFRKILELGQRLQLQPSIIE